MLVLCQKCHRHFRPNEGACPFCGAAVPPHAPAARAFIHRGASRSRRYALRAAIVAGGATASCGGTGAAGSTHDGGVNTALTGGFGGVASGGAGNAGGVDDPGQACPGVEEREPAIACRAAADCAARTGYTADCRNRAQVPSECLGLTPNGPVHDCDSNADCNPDWECRVLDPCVTTCVLTAPCNSQNCNGTRSCVDGSCVQPPCSAPGGTCPGGFECGQNSFGAPVCVPRRCDNGFVCPPGLECTPSLIADEHGCLGPTCMQDSDCDCGYCVNSQCAAREGACNYQIIMAPYGCVFPDEEWV